MSSWKNTPAKSAYQKEYSRKHADKKKEYNKEYYKQHKEEIKVKRAKYLTTSVEKRRDNQREWFSKNPQKSLWHKAKSSAKRRGREFSISVEDVIIPEVCPYFGVPLVLEKSGKRERYGASIDRADSSKGYVKGNIEIISDLANSMKQDATVEELIAFAKGVLKKYGRVD